MPCVSEKSEPRLSSGGHAWHLWRAHPHRVPNFPGSRGRGGGAASPCASAADPPAGLCSSAPASAGPGSRLCPTARLPTALQGRLGADAASPPGRPGLPLPRPLGLRAGHRDSSSGGRVPACPGAVSSLGPDPASAPSCPSGARSADPRATWPARCPLPCLAASLSAPGLGHARSPLPPSRATAPPRGLSAPRPRSPHSLPAEPVVTVQVFWPREPRVRAQAGIRAAP